MVKLLKKFTDLIYKIKCKYWSKYSTIKPRTIKDTMYYDKDVLMIHCMFECLCQYIEKMRSNPRLNDEKIHPDCLTLYNWWNQIYIKKSDKIGRMFKNSSKYSEKQIKRMLNQSISLDLELRNNLHLLVDRLEYMWR